MQAFPRIEGGRAKVLSQSRRNKWFRSDRSQNVRPNANILRRDAAKHLLNAITGALQLAWRA
jgi:hypothetical protein